MLLVAGAVLAGAGHGLAFLAAQDDLTRIAPDEQRAEVSAALYVCIYLGVSIPVIGIGVLAVATTLFIAVATFAVVTGGGALALAAWHWRRRRPDEQRRGRSVDAGARAGEKLRLIQSSSRPGAAECYRHATGGVGPPASRPLARSWCGLTLRDRDG